jgi:uncharacterized protein
MMLIQELAHQGVSPKHIFYINLDTIIQSEQFKNPTLLVSQIEQHCPGGQRAYLFIDEVQRLENPGQFLKGVYDLGKNIKIYATGSSSIEIQSKIKEFLTGRKRETHIFPLSYKELIHHEEIIPADLNSIKLSDSSGSPITGWQNHENLYGRYLRRKLEEMAVYGGYPAILTTEDREERLEELGEIYQSYIKKDIIEFLLVGKVDVFNHLVKVLSSQVGNLVNKSEICSLLGSNSVTLTKYMEILKETYITGYLPPYVSNRRNEVKSAHKSFFIDNGLRNYAIRQFGAFENRQDRGQLIENLVFSELVKDDGIYKQELFFWRTKGGAEMDFILHGNEGIIPVEIKSGPAKPGSLSRSFHSFLERFSPASAVFLNRDLFHIEKIKNTTVYYIPIHWFLLYGPGIIEE